MTWQADNSHIALCLCCNNGFDCFTFRNFVLNEDLALDYDIGGLGVSATFVITLAVFFVLMQQVCVATSKHASSLNKFFYEIINLFPYI